MAFTSLENIDPMEALYGTRRPRVRNTSESIIESEKNHFEGFKHLIHLLDQYSSKGLKYSFVGTLALEAGFGLPYRPLDRDKRLRDVDILILDDPQKVLPEVRTQIGQRIRSKKIIFSVDFLITREPEYSNDPTQSRGAMKRREDGSHALVFRDIEVPLPAEATAIEERIVLGPDGDQIVVPAHSIATQYQFYWKNIGIVRRKDKKSADRFKKLAKKRHLPLGENGPLEEAFKSFSGEARKRYPHLVKAYSVYWRANEQWVRWFGKEILPRSVWVG